MSAGVIELHPALVRSYGCTRCQRWHDEAREPEVFRAHLHWQSKGGVSVAPDPGHWTYRQGGLGPVGRASEGGGS